MENIKEKIKGLEIEVMVNEESVKRLKEDNKSIQAKIRKLRKVEEELLEIFAEKETEREEVVERDYTRDSYDDGYDTPSTNTFAM